MRSRDKIRALLGCNGISGHITTLGCITYLICTEYYTGIVGNSVEWKLYRMKVYLDKLYNIYLN